jgi:2',3'-cyclic-nucleotide 2'-phosphodiesterase (5'-nucleotidase family)
MANTDTNFKNGGEVERPKEDDGILMNNNDEEEGQEMETVNIASHNNDGVVMAKTKRNKKMWWLIIMLVVLVIVALAVILPCYFLLIAPSSNGSDSISKNYPKISSESPDTIIGEMPMDICSELYPGEGDCTGDDSDEVRQGGRLCNLVAKSMINTTMSVDIALINSGVCQTSLLRPDLKIGDIQNAIAANELVVVEMSGDNLVNILNEAVSSSFNGGPSSAPESYPYAAGLRYSVEANLMPSERISNIEINLGLRDDGIWEPINTRKFYKVVTTAPLADGSMGYYSFGNVINDWKTPLNIETTDVFYNYVKNNEENWWSLPDNEYSTQYFIDENEEPTLAMVPKRICHALIPGKPESSSCSAEDVVHGGEVCSLVAWGLYDQSFGVDVVLLKGDTCTGDIDDGKLGQSDIDNALFSDQSLVTIDLTGSVIKSMIEEGISAVLENDTKGAYPYFGGLRFDVNKSSAPGERATNIEIRTSPGSWIPITDTDSYTMLTTFDIATGEDPSYSTISQADMSTMQNNNIALKDEFAAYAIEWKELYSLSEDKTSTQSYV